jgi:hypothetical protein
VSASSLAGTEITHSRAGCYDCEFHDQARRPGLIIASAKRHAEEKRHRTWCISEVRRSWTPRPNAGATP